MSSLFYKIYLFNSKRRGAFYAVLLLLIVIFSLLLTKIEFREDITDIFPSDKQLDQVDILFNSSAINNNLILHFYCADSGNAIPDSLILISDRLDSALVEGYDKYISERMLVYSDSLITRLYDYFLKYLPVYLEPEDYRTITERISVDGVHTTLQNNLKNIMSPIGIFGGKMILNDPFSFVQLPLSNFQKSQFDENFSLYKNHLLSKDRKHLLYFLQLSNQASETAENSKLIAGIDELVKGLSSSRIKIEYFGAPAVAVANATRIKSDITISVTLAIIIIMIMIVMYFKSIKVFLLVLFPGTFGVFSALAILSVIRDQISLISLGIGSVMVGITVDFGLHLFSHRKDDKSMQAVFNSITQPILMSSFTTLCAFFSLVFIKSEALTDLGLFVGIGVLNTSLFSLLVLPHFLPHKLSVETSDQSLLERGLKKISALNLYKIRALQIVFVIITLISIIYWGKIAFNNDLMSLNYMPQELEVSERNLSDISTVSGQKIYVMVIADDFWSALEKNKLLNEKLAKLKENNDILSFNAVNTIIPDQATQQERIDRWRNYWEQRDAEGLRKSIMSQATEIGFNSEVYPGLGAYLDKEYTMIQDNDLTEIIKLIGNKYITKSKNQVALLTIVTLDPKNKETIVSALDSDTGVKVLDKGPIARQLLNILSRDFNKLIMISLLVIFGILLVIFGRGEIALITIAPVALAWLWTIGLMAFLGLTFNIVNIIICSLIFGVGIDYSIFNVQSLTVKYAQGKDNRVAFKVSILLSAFTTLAGIGVLVFAQHPAIKSIGLIAVIGVSSVLFLTLFLQDAVYAIFIQNRKDRGLPPFTLQSLFLSVIAFSVFLLGCIFLMALRVVMFIPLWPKKQKLVFHYFIMMYCRFLMYLMVNLRKNIIDRQNIDFSKPSIIISNHHSFLDILLLLMFHPKVVMVTNHWVYNSPFFGIVVRYADFILSTNGLESQLEKAKKVVEQGYSIIVFPEGTRSETAEINRFHKGAFFLAEHLQLDVQPVVLHGTHDAMPKKDSFYLRNQSLTIKFLEPIRFSDLKFGQGYKERTKEISRFFKGEYSKIRAEKEDHLYFRELLHKNFIYKGPVTEWYCRIKTRLENHYELFHKILPKEGTIVDVGCGLGFLSYSLTLNSAHRKVIGIDYDQNKIELATNCPVKPQDLVFVHADAVTFNYPEVQAFVVSDVLHYLKEEEQVQLMERLMGKLLPGGIIVVRDGDREMNSRHKNTRLSEFFSINIGFNKARNQLNFISEKWLHDLADRNKWGYLRMENSRLTSNTISVLTKPTYGKI